MTTWGRVSLHPLPPAPIRYLQITYVASHFLLSLIYEMGRTWGSRGQPRWTQQVGGLHVNKLLAWHHSQSVAQLTAFWGYAVLGRMLLPLLTTMGSGQVV